MKCGGWNQGGDGCRWGTYKDAVTCALPGTALTGVWVTVTIDDKGQMTFPYAFDQGLGGVSTFCLIF